MSQNSISDDVLRSELNSASSFAQQNKPQTELLAIQKQRQENERIQRSLNRDRAQDQFYQSAESYETQLSNVRRQIQIAMNMNPEQGPPLTQQCSRQEPKDLSVSGLQTEPLTAYQPQN